MLTIREFNEFKSNEFVKVGSRYLFKFNNCNTLEIVKLQLDYIYIDVYQIFDENTEIAGFLFESIKKYKISNNYLVVNLNNYNMSKNSKILKIYSHGCLHFLKLCKSEIVTNLPTILGVNVES